MREEESEKGRKESRGKRWKMVFIMENKTKGKTIS